MSLTPRQRLDAEYEALKFKQREVADLVARAYPNGRRVKVNVGGAWDKVMLGTIQCTTGTDVVVKSDRGGVRHKHFRDVELVPL